MKEFDLFDLFKNDKNEKGEDDYLSFDPPASSKDVKDKVERKIKELRVKRQNMSQTSDQTTTNWQIDELQEISSNYLKFKALAEKKKSKELEALNKIIKELKDDGEDSYTKSDVTSYRKKTHLSRVSIEKIFESTDLKLYNPKGKIPEYLKETSNINVIHSNLDALGIKLKKSGLDPLIAKNLYSFTAYISNETENIEKYSSEKLKNLLDSKKGEYTSRPDDLGKLCSEILQGAVAYVFDSDDNKNNYDIYLEYNSEKFKKLFAKMKREQDDDLLAPNVAGKYIDEISELFSDNEVALAIYNKEAGFTDGKCYRPPRKERFRIPCAYDTSHMNKFSSEKEAKEKNECQFCQKPLFKKCTRNSCGKLIPAYKDRCPHCGYIFSNAAKFPELLERAKKLFENGDLDKAQDKLDEAKEASPNENDTDIVSLQKKIDQARKEIADEIKNLYKLVSEEKYQKAKTELASIRSKYPNESEFDKIEQKIIAGLKEVKEQEAEFSGFCQQVQNALEKNNFKDAWNNFHQAQRITPADKKDEIEQLRKQIEKTEAEVNTNKIQELQKCVEELLDGKCLDQAQKKLDEAKNVSPNENNVDIVSLQKKIDQAQKEKSDKIKHLRKLVSDEEYQKAKTELASIRNKYPNESEFDKIEQKIIAGLKEIKEQEAEFSKLCQQAKRFLVDNNFKEAWNVFYQAKAQATPDKKSELDALKKQIEKAEAEAKEPLDELNKLISATEFQAAQAKLVEIKKKHPNLNVSKESQTINVALAKADRQFENAKKLSLSERVNECLSIVRQQCIDHFNSLDFLSKIKTLPCGSIRAEVGYDPDVINVSWTPSPEQGVTYQLVRKTGRVSPVSEKDGESMPLKYPKSCSFIDNEDKNITPGTFYSYSVFSVRTLPNKSPVFSEPIKSDVCVLYPCVQDLHISQQGKNIRIVWREPKNCIDVTISRSCDGHIETLSNSVHGCYIDTNIQYGKKYTYRIYANYGDNAKSDGLVQIITPRMIVSSFSINVSENNDNNYVIGWDISQKDVELEILLDDKLLTKAKSEEESVKVTLPQGCYGGVISVKARSGDKWIKSDNSISVCMPYKIDEKKCVITEKRTLDSSEYGFSGYHYELKIPMPKKIPDNISEFIYVVRTGNENNSTEEVDKHWVNTEYIEKKFNSSEIKMIKKVDFKDEIKISNFIKKDESVFSAFFVSLFTNYSNQNGGKNIISEPHRITIARPLLADLYYSYSIDKFFGILHKKNTLKLSVTLFFNIPVFDIPELLFESSNKQLIKRIDEEKLVSPTTKYQKVYEIETDIPVKELKKCFLYTQGEICIPGREL